MAATATFAFVWAIARAAVQSITIDEADTYLAWVARPNPSHWEPSANNHVLNSLLMRLSTSVFGVSELSVRAPALLGAAIYILAAWALVRLLSAAVSVQWPVFATLVFNPFIFDHLVAARGYSLALGLMLAAIAAAAYSHARGWSLEKASAACSMLLSLSVAANFSFAIIDALLAAAIAVWAAARTPAIGARARVLAASVAPGLAITLFISAPAMLHWSKHDMVYGSVSLGEWFGELIRDSLWELNPQIVNPMLMRALNMVKPWLIPAVLLPAAWQWLRGRGSRLAYGLLAVAAAAVTTHWLAFQLSHVLMPKERTAIWLVPLVTLAVGAVAAKRRALMLALYTLSFYFLLCLRLTYFREWYWDAEVRRVYSVLAYYNRTYGVTEVSSDWMYTAALNFYRRASGHETLDEIPSTIPPPRGKQVYVLNWSYEEPLIRDEGLRVVYRGAQTDVVVAIRPEVETRPVCPTLRAVR